MKKLLFVFLVGACSFSINAQNPFGKLKDLNLKKIPNAGNILMGKEPITTSLDDAKTEVPEMDDFVPEAILPGDQLPRSIDGSFYVFPGVWEFHLKSYCMKAGTYGPKKVDGDGYLYAPLEGPKAGIVRSILMNAYKHPEIKQLEIQKLIWAIIARADFKEMPEEYMLTAAKLLDPKQIVELNTGVINKMAQKEFNKMIDKAPAPVRRILEAENKLRSMMRNAQTSYEDLERVAVLTGVVPDEGGREVKKGRWSLTPQGFYIRYFALDYRYLVIQLYVPNEAYMASANYRYKLSESKSGFVSFNVPYLKLKEFNPADHPSTPRPPRQRLGPSNQKQPPDNRDDALDKANRILGGADNAQTGFGLATDPLGTVVDKVNPLSPGNMFSRILDFITSNGRKISDALNGDPPDPNYKEFAKVEPFDYRSLKQTPFKDEALNNKANDFADAYLNAYALMKALVSSNDKQGGAREAKDDFWANKQAQAIIYYKKKVGDALMTVCSKWDEFLSALQSQVNGKIVVSQDNLRAYQEKLRTNGFSSEEMAAFRFLKMTDAQIEEAKKDRLSYKVGDQNADFIEQSRNVMKAWKEYGKVYSAFPSIPAPWE